MTILVAPSEQATARFQIALGNDFSVAKNLRELREALGQKLGETLVVIAPEVSLEEALEIAQANRSRPELGIILVRARLEVSTLTQAMQAGVREVVAADDAEGLLSAVARSLALSRKLAGSHLVNAPMQRGKTALVFAAKGGVGKTTLAINLAEALALEGDKSVCLLDLDLQFGDIAVALQLEPSKNISAAIRMRDNLDDAGIRSMLVQYRPNLHVMLAPMEPADVEFISSELVEKVIISLQHQFDYLVIDSPPAFTDFILKAFDLADDYLLLTTMEVPSVKNLKVTLETLDALGMPTSKTNIVVNRSTAKVGITIADVQKSIGRPIFASIPESNIVPNLLNQGKTVVSENQRHPVGQAFMSIARFVRSGADGDAGHVGRFGGLFSSRRRGK